VEQSAILEEVPSERSLIDSLDTSERLEVLEILSSKETNSKKNINRNEQESIFSEITLTSQNLQEEEIPIINKDNLSEMTLTGYLIKLLRKNGKMNYEHLHQEISKVLPNLCRSDGSKYQGNTSKIIKACLTSSNVFKESDKNIWEIQEEEAREYEEKTNKKLKEIFQKKRLRNRKKGDSSKPINLEDEKETQNFSENNTNHQKGFEIRKQVKEKRRYKRPREKYEIVADLLKRCCKALKSDKRYAYLIKNPFKKLKGNETLEFLWQKLGKDRFFGILQCFDYFYPLIDDQLKGKVPKKIRAKENKIDDQAIKEEFEILCKKVKALQNQIELATKESHKT
jgi:hypothetical protein